MNHDNKYFKRSRNRDIQIGDIIIYDAPHPDDVAIIVRIYDASTTHSKYAICDLLLNDMTMHKRLRIDICDLI